jgi:hypothetical protein
MPGRSRISKKQSPEVRIEIKQLFDISLIVAYIIIQQNNFRKFVDEKEYANRLIPRELALC